ncbi:MAG: hypothetical protein HRT41_05905 [Campylobacteraceae bacterium]|nr:hypothetical protein [Campylobacteraceae bacterium]
MYQVFVISIAKPIQIGLYENYNLIKTYDEEGKSSDILPSSLKSIFKKYDINEIYYVNSPGSYMAIKVAYVFLKTLCIVKDIEFFASFGFHFNENSPIKALGKKYFFYKNNEIITDFLHKECTIAQFLLPKVLNTKLFSKNTLPIYNLPAV